MTEKDSQFKGIVLVLLAAIFWAGAGTLAQFLVQENGFSIEWLVDQRLLLAGLLLLVLNYRKEHKRIWSIWKSKHDVISILLFSIAGMVAVQYTYFAAIKYGNAATATVLQYLSPVIIVVYIVGRNRKLPNKYEAIAVLMAVLGTILLVTHGKLTGLSISGKALFWGITSAFALAFYTLHPVKLLARYGSTVVVGWGMLIGGIAFSFVHPPWKFEGTWSVLSFSSFVYIIIFGTLLAFFFFLESFRYVKPTVASVLACVEPLTASILSVLFLHVSFGIPEWIGTFCILSTIFISAKKPKKLKGISVTEENNHI
ncbi:DMT family transporter [Rummeliibacillus sp. POC4]|uniref:DMT family transporter n=1 Tax=Rummeliibacillus sp. POC4 TaxID=2305899 RepID=UPI000E675404|nr:EamA family transporter [Rummeliibacillus sp. POC4]RIJ65007.1 EamA family transporter [Rummeliibacillus sp. POC4]